MKKIIAFIVMLFFIATSWSQELRMQTFRLCSLDGNPMEKTIYYYQNDSVLHISTAWSDGIVIMRMDNRIDYKDLFLVIRQDEERVSRIKMDYFKKHNSIVLPFVKITLIEDRIIKTQPDLRTRQPYKAEDFKIIHSVNLDNYNGFKHYFPIKCLEYSYEGYYSMMSDSSYHERFYEIAGRYPDDRDIDSLVLSGMRRDAMYYENWCSLNLYELKEPVLFDNYTQDVYRFTWFINNAVHHEYEPYSIRIEPDEIGGAIMYFSYRLWDYCEEYPIYCDIIPIDKEVYQKFAEMIDRIGLVDKPSIVDEEDCFEGQYLNILEANVDGQYHVIFRGEGEDPALDELQKFLWSLTGLGENKIVHKKQRIE